MLFRLSRSWLTIFGNLFEVSKRITLIYEIISHEKSVLSFSAGFYYIFKRYRNVHNG